MSILVNGNVIEIINERTKMFVEKTNKVNTKNKPIFKFVFFKDRYGREIAVYWDDDKVKLFQKDLEDAMKELAKLTRK